MLAERCGAERAEHGAAGVVPGCSFRQCSLPTPCSLPGGVWSTALPGPALDTDVRRVSAHWCQDDGP